MNYFKYRPMAAIGFASLAITLVSVLTGFIFGCGIASLAAGSVLLIIALFSKRIRKITVLMYLCAALIFSGSLILSNFVYGYEAAQNHVGDKVQITAKITGDVQSKDSRVIYTLKTESLDGEKLSVKLRLSSNTLIDAYAGDTVSFTSKIRPISENGRDFELNCLSRGIYLNTYIYEPDLNLKLVKSPQVSPERILQSLRDNIKSRIYRNLPNENGAVAVAMLLGDSSGLSEKTENAFSTAGVSHLFAVSGLHLSVWAMGLYYILSHLHIRRGVCSLTVIIFTVFFMSLTGFTESVSRAGFMLLIMLLGNVFRRQSDPVNSLGAATAILLFINPFSCVSISLLLSFCSTLGILLLFKPLERFYMHFVDRIKNKLLKKFIKAVLSIVAISLCASVASLPVNTAVFGGISLVSPLTNLLVSLPSTVLMVSAGFSALFFDLHSIGKALSFICGAMAKYILAVTERLSQLKYSFIRTDNVFFISAVILTVAGIICCVVLIKQNNRALKASIALTLCICVLSGFAYMAYSHSLVKMSVINVGDGICVTVENNGEIFILGCGGSDYESVRNIQDAVKNKNIDFMLMPNLNRWNSYSADKINRSFSVGRIFCSEEYNGAIKSSAFCLNPWDGGSVEFCNDGENTYSYCIFGSTDMLILFDCTRAETIPQKCLEADILICSYYLPQGFKLDGFENVIVSSSDEISADVSLEISKEVQNVYSVVNNKYIGVDIRKNNYKLYSE